MTILSSALTIKGSFGSYIAKSNLVLFYKARTLTIKCESKLSGDVLDSL